MSYYSKEQIEQARQMDLLTYLQRYEPGELVHVSGNTYCTRTHDSLKISNGKWYWWSRSVGGRTALDYLTIVQSLTFMEAVERILGTAPEQRPIAAVPPSPSPPAERLPFSLPPRHTDNRRVFAYLTSRGIDAEIINHCIKSGQLYEDGIHHNCVFVGFDGDTPNYAALRGTLSRSTFVGEVPGSDKRHGFLVAPSGERHTVCVFESAIDALSYLTLLKLRGRDWRQAACLSVGGVQRTGDGGPVKLPPALETYLENHPSTKKVILCFDRDGPGMEAAHAVGAALEGLEVVENFPPRGKDFNDFLQLKKGIVCRAATRGGDAR